MLVPRFVRPAGCALPYLWYAASLYRAARVAPAGPTNISQPPPGPPQCSVGAGSADRLLSWRPVLTGPEILLASTSLPSLNQETKGGALIGVAR